MQISKRTIIISILIIVLVISAFTRFYNIADQGLWFDEILTAATAEQDVNLILEDIMNDWLHYLFVKIGLLFSYSIIAMKITEIAAGILSVFLLFLIGKELKNQWVGLIVAFLGAISPAAIYFSGEVRHYSFVILFAAAFFLIFLKLVKSKKVIFGVLLIILSLALFFTHYLTIILVASFLIWEGLMLLMALIRKLLRKKISINKGSLVTFLTFAVGGFMFFLLRFQGDFRRVFEDNTSGFVFQDKIFFGTTYFEIPAKNYPMIDFFKYLGEIYSVQDLVGMLFFIGVFALGLVFLMKKNWQIGLFSLIALALVITLPFFLQVKHWWDHKYFLFYLPIWLGIIGYGIAAAGETIAKLFRTPTAKKKVYLVVILFLVSVLSIYSVIEAAEKLPDNHVQQYSWQEVARRVTDIVSEDDVIYLSTNEMSQLSFIYFFNHGPGVPYQKGERTVEQTANFIHPQYFAKMNPAHLYNNKNVIIESFSIFLANPRKKYDELATAYEQGNSLWYVGINNPEGIGFSSVVDATLYDNINGVGIYQIIPKPEIVIDPLVIEEKKESYSRKIKMCCPKDLAVMWYQNGLEISEKNLTISGDNKNGELTLPIKFESSDKNVYPPEIKLEMKMSLPNDTAISFGNSADGLLYTELEKIEGPIEYEAKNKALVSFVPEYNEDGVTFIRISISRQNECHELPILKEVQIIGKFDKKKK